MTSRRTGSDDAAPPDPQELPVYSRSALARQDGDRRPAFVACLGLVYDVSRSPEWRGGLHRNLHWAGQDLSAELADAPHGIETLQRCPVVGRFLDADSCEPDLG